MEKGKLGKNDNCSGRAYIFVKILRKEKLKQLFVFYFNTPAVLLSSSSQRFPICGTRTPGETWYVIWGGSEKSTMAQTRKFV